MKTSTSNTTHNNEFARITKFHDLAKHEAKRADQSAYDAMCELMQADACIFVAPQGFSTWTTESQIAKVAKDFGLIVSLPVSIEMEVSA